eukprot:763794-Hanusia_phi.AAC.1
MGRTQSAPLEPDAATGSVLCDCHRGLSTVYLNKSSCGLSPDGKARFGNDCQYKCYGKESGRYYICPEGLVGFDCSRGLGAPFFSASLTAPTSFSSTDGRVVYVPACALNETTTQFSVSMYSSSSLCFGVDTTTIVSVGPVVILRPTTGFASSRTSVSGSPTRMAMSLTASFLKSSTSIPSPARLGSSDSQYRLPRPLPGCYQLR